MPATKQKAKTVTTVTEPRVLVESEIQWMRDWKELPFLHRDVHAELEHEMRLCMKGVESAIVIGDRGVGKSKAVQFFCDKIEQEECERCMAPGSTDLPRAILRYDTSKATGTKTALLDLWTMAAEETPSAGMQRRSSPQSIIGEIVQALEIKNVALVCIDEAQMISPENLDLLRQVPDAARERGYALGLLLVGSGELRDSLVAIRQLGQRFATELHFQPLSRDEWASHWSGFHPHLEELRAALPAVAWRALTEEVFRVTRGKFRRVQHVLVNANELALVWKRAIDAEILRFAMEKLAPEN